MEKKTTPKKSTSKKTQVKATTKKAAPKKTAQVVKTQTTTQKKAPVKKTQTKTVKKTAQVKKQTSRNTKNANTGYLFALLSLIAWVVPVIGAVVSVSGIYCCYSGLKGRKSLAAVGLLINILFLGVALVNVNVDLALLM